MINESQIVNYGVVQNGKIKYFKPTFVEQQLLSLEGKQVGMIVFEKDPAVTEDMHGFLRGGIIRGVCMQTEMFAGNTEKEIYNILKEKCGFYIERSIHFGNETITQRDYLHMDSCGKKRGRQFIDEIVRYLAEHDIIVPDPSEFLLNKYKSVKSNGKRNQKKDDQPNPEESANPRIITPRNGKSKLFLLADS